MNLLVLTTVLALSIGQVPVPAPACVNGSCQVQPAPSVSVQSGPSVSVQVRSPMACSPVSISSCPCPVSTVCVPACVHPSVVYRVPAVSVQFVTPHWYPSHWSFRPFTRFRQKTVIRGYGGGFSSGGCAGGSCQ